MNRDTHASEINRLAAQVDALYAEINKINRHFWPGIDDLDEYLYGSSPGYFSPGSVEQTQLAWKYTYNAWIETPGALEFIKAKHAASR